MHGTKPFSTRKATRIPNYDYSRNNYYFITICTHNKECLFGTTQLLNAFGRIAAQDFLNLPSHYEGVYVDQFVIMPNHVHAIIILDHDSENRLTVDQIVGSYKAGVSRKVRELEKDKKVWQRSFHDHIIRNRTSYEKIYQYVKYNPLKWEDDCFYPKEKKT